VLEEDKMVNRVLIYSEKNHIKRLLEKHHITKPTLADKLRVLELDAPDRLLSYYILRKIFYRLTPTVPDHVFSHLDQRDRQQIVAIRRDKMIVDSPMYRTGLTIADLHFVYGISRKQIEAEVQAGGLVLSDLTPIIHVELNQEELP
jgi:hypothetical protein